MCWMFQRNVKAGRLSRKWDFPFMPDKRFIYCYLLFLSWIITEDVNFIFHINTIYLVLKTSLDELICSEFCKSSTSRGIGQQITEDTGLLVCPYRKYLKMNFDYSCRSDLKYLLHFSARYHYPSSRGSRKDDIPFLSATEVMAWRIHWNWNKTQLLGSNSWLCGQAAESNNLLKYSSLHCKNSFRSTLHNLGPIFSKVHLLSWGSVYSFHLRTCGHFTSHLHMKSPKCNCLVCSVGRYPSWYWSQKCPDALRNPVPLSL